jgi:hypothetical protein
VALTTGLSGISGEASDVADSRTGKLLAKLSPPENGSFAEVGGGADDRPFMLADSLLTTNWGRFDLYLLRLAPGAARPAPLTKLAVKAVTGSPVRS